MRAAPLFALSFVAASATAQEIPLTRVENTVWTVSARVGTETLPFILDTGAGMTVVTPKLAAAVGCTPHGRATGHRMSNERVDLPLCDDVTIAVGGVEVRHETVGVLDVARFLPPRWPAIGGFISLKSFDGRSIVLDLPHGRLRLVATAGPPREQPWRPLRARLARPVTGLALEVYVAAIAGGETAWLELDSGSDGTVLAKHAAAPFVAAGTKLAPDRFRVPLAVAGLPATDETVAVRDLIIDGDLGLPWIEKHALWIDLQRGRVWGEPAR